MIAYTTVGTNDIEKAAAFYDVVLAELGAKRALEMDGFISWTTAEDAPMFCIIKPNNGEAATVGNGVMIALGAADQDAVQRTHAKALSLGGKDEGAVGPRGDHFYCGYFRDLDGNKLNIFCRP